jgi:hypothetical protein
LRNDTDHQPPVEQRACSACGRPFHPHGRRTYCSDACRQRGFRLRQRPADELQLGFGTRLPKSAIVYECPACETRFIGQQRCDQCGVFCRRLGPGGPCPHCDEAVAIADLVSVATVR